MQSKCLKLKMDQAQSGGKRPVALVHAGRGMVKFGRKESQSWMTRDDLAGLADAGWSSDAPSGDSYVGDSGNGPFFVGDLGRVAASDGDDQGVCHSVSHGNDSGLSSNDTLEGVCGIVSAAVDLCSALESYKGLCRKVRCLI